MTIRPGSQPPAPPHLPEVLFARDHTSALVAARVRAGTWEPLVRGSYIAAGTVDGPKERALAEIVAVHQRLRLPHWFSHESAALLWGLPLWRDATAVHLRQASRSAQRQAQPVRRHISAVPDQHQAEVGGLPVTSLALTAVDCARALPPLDALVIADAALRAGADRTQIADLLDGLRGRNGTRTAAAVLAAADPGAESAPETAVRYHLLVAGLPVPQTQVEVPTWRGTYWADLGYPQWQLLIEYDGRTKYDGDEWFREKRRQDAIMETGDQVVRVTAEDLRSPARIVTRVRRFLPQYVPQLRPSLR
ncbi:MAG: hypothetical protein FWH11_14535 [Micrococcales bacterium]|nr:hypothetical protein [Micrococcales bacterium]